MALSKAGKASQLALSEDRLTVTGHKGYRTVRCSHGVFNVSGWAHDGMLFSKYQHTSAVLQKQLPQ